MSNPFAMLAGSDSDSEGDPSDAGESVPGAMSAGEAVRQHEASNSPQVAPTPQRAASDPNAAAAAGPSEEEDVAAVAALAKKREKAARKKARAKAAKAAKRIDAGSS